MHSDARNEVSRAVLDSIRRIVRVLRESSALAERKVGISGAQLFVLQNLAEAPAMSVGELAERTLTHQSTVSVVVRKLVEKGLVTKVASSEDARRVDLGVTPRGRVLLSRAPGAAQERLFAGVRSLSASERKTLAKILGKLTAAVESTPRAPVMFFEEEDDAADARPAARRPRRKS
ncbi:MAG TPA: MarR family transcriptional regulator [bacterium]|nr:MarR family transcriptional regulator [bacterium]